MFGIDITIGLHRSRRTRNGRACLWYPVLAHRNDKGAESAFARSNLPRPTGSRSKQARDRMSEMSKRRKSVQDSLKDLEKEAAGEGNREKHLPLKVRLVQAGLKMPSISVAAILHDESFVLGLFIAALPFPRHGSEPAGCRRPSGCRPGRPSPLDRAAAQFSGSSAAATSFLRSFQTRSTSSCAASSPACRSTMRSG